MPFQIPTLPDLVQRTARAFGLNLKGSDAWLYPNNVADSAKVIAGAVWEPFSFLDYIWRQMFAHLCDGETLDKHGRELGMTRLPASVSSGTATLNGTAATVVPAGLELKRADGLRYLTTTGGTVGGGGTLDVQVTAVASGRAGNALPGVALALTSVFAGLTTAATVAAAGIGGGADVEGDEAYRSRILYRKRHVPHGGAVHDYVMWAREVNGVTHVFVDPVTATNGRSSVGVWFLMADTYANGIPLPADVAVVAAYIESRRPAGARVAVAAPVAVPQAITVQGLAPNTKAVRDAVLSELRDLFRREMRVSTLTTPQSVYRSKIWEAVSIAAGEEHHVITSPASDAALSAGQIATFGSVSYV